MNNQFRQGKKNFMQKTLVFTLAFSTFFGGWGVKAEVKNSLDVKNGSSLNNYRIARTVGGLEVEPTAPTDIIETTVSEEPTDEPSVAPEDGSEETSTIVEDFDTLEATDIPETSTTEEPIVVAERSVRAGETQISITDETQLLALLNARVVPGGNEYVLTRDMEINASQLDKALYQSATNDSAINSRGSFMSSFDGKGFKIKVIVDTTTPSRALFTRINGTVTGVPGVAAPVQTTFKNLTVQYTGDVEGVGFAYEVANVTMDNITVLVQDDGGVYHNIVPMSERGTNPITYAAGFAYYLGAQTPVFPTTVFPITNITVKAGTIGTPENTPEDQLGDLYTVTGFVYQVMNGLTVDGVVIDVENILARGNRPDRASGIVAGFAYYIHSKTKNGTEFVKNITINVAKNIEYYDATMGYFGSVYNGVMGFFYAGTNLDNATLNVGGDIISHTGDKGGATLTADKGTSIVLIGTTMGGRFGEQSMNAYNMVDPQFKNLHVNVNGSVKSLNRGSSSITLGLYSQYSDIRGKESTENINVNIKGDVVAEHKGLPLASTTQTGMSLFLNYNLKGGSNKDTFHIGGNVILKNNQTNGSGYSAFFGNYASELYDTTSSTITGRSYIKNQDLEVAGDVIVESTNGVVEFHGLFSGSSLEVENNSVKYLKGVTVTSGGTQGGSYAQASGLSYSDGGASRGVTERKIKNNFVYVGGDFKVEANKEAMVSGLITELSTVGKATDNILRVDGVMSSNSLDNATSLAAGFGLNVKGNASNNTIYVKESVQATPVSDTSAANAFAFESFAGSTISANTVLGRPGKYLSTDPLSYYETYVYTVDANATIADNFYTSLLGGQRVTNEISYDAAEQKFVATPGVQTRSKVSDVTDYSNGAVYLEENNHGAVTISGLASVVRGNRTAVETTLTGDSLTTASAVVGAAATVNVNGKQAVIDLPGIGHPYENKTISGNLYADMNSNFTYDAGDHYIANEVITGKVDGVGQLTLTTDANGNYTTNVPLLNCFHETEYTFSWDALDLTTYSWVNHLNNNFTNNGVLRTSINYLDNVVHQGIVEAEAVVVVPPTPQPLVPPIVKPVVEVGRTCQDDGYPNGYYWNGTSCVYPTAYKVPNTGVQE